jgi:PPOX class probable F420-dependent enzyme
MPTLSDIAATRYVSLVTFRKSGEPVATPVWVAGEADALLVITVGGTGKVKRARNNPRVELSPCSMSGRVANGAPVVAGVTEIVTDATRIAEYTRVLRAKYGWQFRLTFGTEAKPRERRGDRVILRITPEPLG